MTTPEQITQYFTQGYAIELIAQATGYTVEQLRPFAPAAAAAAAVAPALPPPPAAGASSIAALAAKLGGAAFGNNADGRRLPPGTHVVDVTEISYKTGLQHGDRLIIEYTAIESTNSETEIGGAYSWPINPNDQYGYGVADIKGWTASLFEAIEPGCPVRANWDSIYVERMVGDGQPARGTRWKVSTTRKNSEGGNAWTKHEGWQVLPTGTVQGLVASPSSVTAPTPAGLPPVPAGLPPMPTPAALPAPAGLPPVPTPAALPPLPPAALPALPTLPGQPVPAGWPAGTAPPPMPGIPGGPK